MAKGWDHDPPAKEKLVPFGILRVATGALMLLFGVRETSDAWVDALQLWWCQVRGGLGQIRRLVIYLDNGPKNSGRRTQFLKRMVHFADWSGLLIVAQRRSDFPVARMVGCFPMASQERTGANGDGFGHFN